jgi:hypothetical protein
MKRLALMLALYAATPAVAAVNSGDPRHDTPSRKSSASIERLIESASRNEEASLPLECRGYYVRAKIRRISQCE